MKDNPIICLIGPSGAGKSTIANNLAFPKVKCYTTREQRGGEVHGDEKYFISYSTFIDNIDDMIAYTYYADNYYGITQGEIFNLEYVPMIYVTDKKGADDLKISLATISGYENTEVVTIFLDSGKSDVERQMIEQGRSDELIKLRLNRYEKDRSTRDSCDYTVTNEYNKIDEAVSKIEFLIQVHTVKVNI